MQSAASRGQRAELVVQRATRRAAPWRRCAFGGKRGETQRNQRGREVEDVLQLLPVVLGGLGIVLGGLGIVLGKEVERSNGSEGKHGLEEAEPEFLIGVEPEPCAISFRNHELSTAGDGDFKANQT